MTDFATLSYALPLCVLACAIFASFATRWL